MPPRLLPRPLLGEALSKLDRLAEYLYGLIDRFFPRSRARLRDYVARRVEGAREILLRLDERVLGARRIADGAYILLMASSRLEGRPARLGPVRVKTLEGRVEERPPRLPPEALYHVEIGPYALKCTCPDAVYAAARADETLARLGFPPQAYKYNLCKHILAGLALLWARGEVDPTKPPYDEALLRALVTAYLATLPPGRRPRVSRIALVYSRTGDAQPATQN